MKQIIFATGNAHKMLEIKEILSDVDADILSMKDVGIDIDIVEDGLTFEENALIKAREIAKHLPEAIVLADDSGLEIDYLNKEPGIYSARYGGEDTSYDIKNQMLIDRMKEAQDGERSGRFVCVIAAVFPSGEEKTCRGTIEGVIASEILGTNGFGYDPIVFLPEYNKSIAQLTSEEKNLISHRGQALRMMKEYL